MTLLTDETLEVADIPKYALQSVQVQYGTENIPTATVRATKPSGEEVTVASTGSGSVEAIFNTLEKLVEEPVKILDYRVSSVGSGRDALGEAVINIAYKGGKYRGRDAAQDVLKASAEAYLDAINREIIQAQLRAKELA